MGHVKGEEVGAGHVKGKEAGDGFVKGEKVDVGNGTVRRGSSETYEGEEVAVRQACKKR